MKKILIPKPLLSTHPPAWVWVLAIQVLLLLGLVQLPLCRKQILRSRFRAVCVSWCSCQRSRDFLKQAAVLFARIFGGLTAQIPHRSCLTRRISYYLFLVYHRFEHGLMVGASLPNNSIASVLSFVPFTARTTEKHHCLGRASSHRLSLFNNFHRIGG